MSQRSLQNLSDGTFRAERELIVCMVFEGSAKEQNCVRDYIILPRLHRDYTKFAQRLHILVS